MRQVTSDRIYSVEEYIQHEWSAAVRSEFINGQLYEMPGEKDINNEIAGNLYVLLALLLRQLGYSIYSHDIKVKIFGESKYYYPDVFITKEEKTSANRYIKFEPILIAEVVPESSQVNYYVDKYIDYTKFPSLAYYLIIEPESSLITCYSKSAQGTWQTIKYTRQDDIINLEKLEVSFTLKQVYQ